MSLESRLAAKPAPKVYKTVLDRWFDELNETERAAVQRAINDTDWRHTDLQAALEAEGAPKVADTTFGAWRRKNGHTK